MRVDEFVWWGGDTNEWTCLECLESTSEVGKHFSVGRTQTQDKRHQNRITQERMAGDFAVLLLTPPPTREEQVSRGLRHTTRKPQQVPL